jgi:hypothetical protein
LGGCVRIPKEPIKAAVAKAAEIKYLISQVGA